MPLKLISLNVEGKLHLQRVLPFLQNEKPEVLCLQEIFQEDAALLQKELAMSGAFFPMCRIASNVFANNAHGILGVAFLTTLPHSPLPGVYYEGNGTIPLYTDLYSEDRVLVYCTVEKENSRFTIGTTHFCWTPNGKPNEKQWQGYHALMNFLQQQKEFILCGDLNAPRGGEMYAAIKTHFQDYLPIEITTTLDPQLHRKPYLRYVVDALLSTSPYKITNVRLVEGVSDHQAVIGILGTNS